MPVLYALGGAAGGDGILVLFILCELSSPLRGGVYTISVGFAGGVVGVPHCPQNASS